jgi:two-component system, OmpR family, alkaline phosphatase synthesis response regulator PhoP
MPKQILAVDDQPNVLRAIEVSLEKAGYEVSTAVDGVEALAKIRSGPPDMVVLDVMMPRMDGFEVLRELQADPNTRDIPVVMLTAKDQDEDIFQGWQRGAEMYLTKPFSPNQLLVMVRRIFQAREQEAAKKEPRIEL